MLQTRMQLLCAEPQKTFAFSKKQKTHNHICVGSRVGWAHTPDQAAVSELNGAPFIPSLAEYAACKQLFVCLQLLNEESPQLNSNTHNPVSDRKIQR